MGPPVRPVSATRASTMRGSARSPFEVADPNLTLKPTTLRRPKATPMLKMKQAGQHSVPFVAHSVPVYPPAKCTPGAGPCA
jgi:hypothetical protein